MVKIAYDLMNEGIISEEQALLRIEPHKLDEMLHPIFSLAALKKAKVITKGLAASPGAASGQIVFHVEDAKKYPHTILVRHETSPEDLEGMNIARGILTARGGMTSHAAVVARGMGKTCICGADAMKMNYKNHSFEVNGVEHFEGDWISLDGSTGIVYYDRL